MTAVWLVFVGLAAICTCFLAVYIVLRWPNVVAVCAVANVLIAWEFPYPPPLASIGGTNVYFLDLLSSATLVVALIQFPQFLRNLRSAAWPWLGLGVMLLLSLGRGLMENSLGTTMNEFRPFLQLYALMLWAMSLKWNALPGEKILSILTLSLGYGLTLLSLYHVAIYGFGATSEFVDAGTGVEQTTRPLVSGQSLVLMLAGILTVRKWYRQRTIHTLISAVIFFSVVVLSQQRTVWAVGVAAVLVVFVAAKRQVKAGFVVLSLVITWAVAVLVSGQFSSQLFSTLSDAASDSGTYDARVRSWINLIEEAASAGAANLMFGLPMGSGFGRFEGVGRWVEFAPHNWYLTIFLRTGMIGLALFIIFLMIILMRQIRARSSMPALAIIIAVYVYGWSYSWPWYVCFYLGWAAVYSSSSTDLHPILRHRSPQESPVLLQKRSLE